MTTAVPGYTSRSAPVPFSEPALWSLVGNTPLLPLSGPAFDRPGLRVLLKAEWLNPGGSVKDRAARAILHAGVAAGALPRRRLLDASSGNTAVAYAMLGAAADIGVTVCVPTNVSSERRILLRMYGAEVIDTDPLEGSDGAIRRAREMAESEPDRYWYADQYGNAANPKAHYVTTGPEIWNGTNQAVSHLVAGIGTSGTIMGAGRYLKERNRKIRVIGVQPSGPFHGLEGLKHLESAIVPPIYDSTRIDSTIFVDTEHAEDAVRRLARQHGMFLGWSAAAAVIAAEQLVSGLPPDRAATVVVVAPDGGTRYLSEETRLVGSAA